MRPAIPPEGEPARIAALRSYDILDTPAEAVFDDLTRLASQVCATPISLITLVDDRRQWFKSKVGLELDETPREIAFCHHTIQEDQFLEVPDALLDERFCGNPLVTGAPGIRYYGGAPLITSDGFRLGSLCVIDHTPRRLSTEQRDGLLRLSRQVVLQMELRVANQRLKEQGRFERDLLDSSSDLIQSISPEGRLLYVNPAWQEALGYGEAEVSGIHIFDLIHPDCRAYCRTIFERAMEGEKVARVNTTFVAKDGRCLEVEGSISVRFKNEQAEASLGIFRDVTQQKRKQAAESGRTAMLERLATADSLEEVLDVLMDRVEQLYPGHPASILLLDDQDRLHVGASRHLPGFFVEAMEGLATGPEVGTCGASAYSKKRVVSVDLKTDPNWAPYLDLANRAGLRACWSEPMLGEDGQVLGTFAVYCRTPESPGEDDLLFLEESSQLAALAVQWRQSQDALRESEALLQRVIEGSQLGYWDWDMTTNRVVYSGRWAQMLGYRPEELEPHFDTWHTRVHPEDESSVMTALHDHIEGRQAIFEAEHRLRGRSGDWRWMLTRGTVVSRDAAGYPVRISGSHRDIHEQKCAEEALHLREAELARFKTTLDQTLDCVFMFQPGSLRFVYVNRGAQAQVGYTEAELLRMTPLDIKPEFEEPGFRDLVQPLLDGTRSVLRFETVHRHRDGQDLPVEIVLQLVRVDEGGQLFVAIVRDIAERKRLEGRLRQFNQSLEKLVEARSAELVESERRYRNLVEWSPDAIFLVRAGRIAFVNPTMMQLFGAERAEELLGKRPYEWLHPDARGLVREVLAQLEEGDGAFVPWTAGRVVRVDGKAVDVEVGASAFEDRGERVIQVVLRDLTERNQAEQQRIALEERNQALVAALGEIVYDWRPPTDDVFWEGDFTHILGYTAGEMGDDSLTWGNRVHPVDRDRVYREIEDAGRENRFYNMEYRFRRRDGTYAWMHDRGVLTLDADGNLVRLLGVMRDITGLKKAELELRQQQELNRLMLENLSEGVVACDAEGTLFLFNKAAREWHGTDPREIPQERWAEYYNLFEGDGVTPLVTERIPLVRAFNGERVRNVEMSIVRTGGAPRFVLASGGPIQDAAGRKYGAVAVMHDITERRQAEMRLRQSLQEKEVLLKEIHHRVKNNLQVVSSLLDMQMAATADPTGQEALRESINRVRSMAMIHTQLYQSHTLARINFGEYTENLVHALFRSMAKSGAVELVCETQDMELNLETAAPCGLILNELISNAFKHAFKDGRPGVLRVAVESVSKGGFRIIVHDNGPGLPEGFDIETSDSLGLQLVATLVYQLKGKLTVQNDNGACFCLAFEELTYAARG